MTSTKDKVSQVARLLGLYHGYEYDTQSINDIDYDKTVARWKQLIVLHNAQFPNSNTYSDLDSIINV